MIKRPNKPDYLIDNPPYQILSHKEVLENQARQTLAHYHQQLQSLIIFINKKLRFTFKPEKRHHFLLLKEVLLILKENNCIQLRFFEENPTEYIHNKVIELTSLKQEISLWIKSNYDFNDKVLGHLKLKKIGYFFQKHHESWHHHAFTLESIKAYLMTNHGYRI
jgi:hypothetical protein